MDFFFLPSFVAVADCLLAAVDGVGSGLLVGPGARQSYSQSQLEGIRSGWDPGTKFERVVSLNSVDHSHIIHFCVT